MQRLPFFLVLICTVFNLEFGFSQKPIFIVDSTAINPWTKRHLKTILKISSLPLSATGLEGTAMGFLKKQ